MNRWRNQWARIKNPEVTTVISPSEALTKLQEAFIGGKSLSIIGAGVIVRPPAKRKINNLNLSFIPLYKLTENRLWTKI